MSAGGVACTGEAPATPPAGFAYHGVIEGFYGTPWSHQDRLDMLAFMGRVGLRDYFYAPKEDPYHLARWRDPYPEAERRQLAELIDASRRHDVVFWYAISPGLSMTYSSAEDYAALMTKIDSIAVLGVRHFGLFLDDVPPVLANEADRAAFEDLAAAHADLTNRLHADLSARGFLLALTPTTYTGAWGDSAYVDRLGAAVHAEVPMFWTGVDVASPTITTEHAQAWGRRIGRPPLIWDNYPVNDYARWRPFLGPVTGRDADLAGSASGIIANPMIQAHASMIPLWTLAAYVRDPASYDPGRARRDAVVDLYGAEAADGLEPILAAFGDNGWDANLLGPLHILRDTIPAGAIERDVAAMEEALAALTPGAAPPLATLLDDLAPFVTRARARLDEFRASPDYESHGDALVYRTDLDRFDAPEAGTSPVVDGGHGDWGNATWHTMRGPAAGAPRIAFARDDRMLHIAIDAPWRPADSRAGDHVGEGDHIAVIVNDDPAHLLTDPGDLTLLFPAMAGGDRRPLARSMGFEGFMAKWLADNRNLTFTEFHVTTFAGEPAPPWRAVAGAVAFAADTSGGRYRAEIALPHENRAHIRLSLTVAVRVDGQRSIYTLATRNYPANPATYAHLVLRAP